MGRFSMIVLPPIVVSMNLSQQRSVSLSDV